jgi:ATP-dependent RNA helicase DOB1
MTDIFEGSIIRLARRLDEFLKQVSLPPISFNLRRGCIQCAVPVVCNYLRVHNCGIFSPIMNLLQLKAAAEAVGEVNLMEKFEKASESLNRGIMFANSLYL